MGTTEHVRLNIRPTPSKGQGWQDTRASNGQMYSFKYQGGHENNGGLKTTLGDGPATLNLTLDIDDRYTLDTVEFRDDETRQCSWRKVSESTGTITFANTQLQIAYYTTNVIDARAADAIVPCDPMIRNEPRP